MKRIYQDLIINHLNHYDQMVFLTGPRQVGKTTTADLTAKLFAQSLGNTHSNQFYLNWDVPESRELILGGLRKVADKLGLHVVSSNKPIVIFDEIHKAADWKNFLKGFYDTYKKKVNLIVTGSARLDVYKKGGDSLIGRYFPYRIHPFSIA